MSGKYKYSSYAPTTTMRSSLLGNNNMTGCIVAGEDDEDDEEEEIVHPNDYMPMSDEKHATTKQSLKKRRSYVNVKGQNDNDEAEDEQEEEEEEKQKEDMKEEDGNEKTIEKGLLKEATTYDDDDADDEEEIKYNTRDDTKNDNQTLYQYPWEKLTTEKDGISLLSNALYEQITPSLIKALERIQEISSSQSHLLDLLQKKEYQRKDDNEKIMETIKKFPLYVNKIHRIKEKTIYLTIQLNKMKMMAETLRIEAQSHALEQEEKKEASTHWNRLYAAKSVENQTSKKK